MLSGVSYRRFSFVHAIENVLISLASVLLQCDVLLLGVFFLMCWTAVPSEHGPPHAQ